MKRHKEIGIATAGRRKGKRNQVGLPTWLRCKNENFDLNEDDSGKEAFQKKRVSKCHPVDKVCVVGSTVTP